jgi:hypothetical protein
MAILDRACPDSPSNYDYMNLRCHESEIAELSLYQSEQAEIAPCASSLSGDTPANGAERVERTLGG